MDSIDAVLYINLEHRTDRKVHILHELRALPIENIHRIDAIPMDNGALGCGLSHIKALEYALQHAWNMVLIVEDDFTFTTTDKLELLCGCDFDVGLLAHNNLQYSDTETASIKRVSFSQTSSAYLIKRDYMPVLLQNVRDAMEDMSKNGRRHENCLDVHWASLQRRDRWYALYPAIGYQYGNYSDIEHRFCEYGC